MNNSLCLRNLAGEESNIFSIAMIDIHQIVFNASQVAL